MIPKPIHTNYSDYKEIKNCKCRLCEEIRRSSTTRKSSDGMTVSQRLRVAYIRLAIYMEILFYIRGGLFSDKKITNIYRKILSLKLTPVEWEEMWESRKMKDWLIFLAD